MIGLFASMEPFAGQHERLGYGFWRRVSSLITDPRHFAIVDAKKSFDRRKRKGSVLLNAASHPTSRPFDAGRNKLPFAGVVPEEIRWKDRKEEILAEVSAKYKKEPGSGVSTN